MAHPTQQVNPEIFDSALWQWIEQNRENNLEELRLKYGLKEPFFSAIAQLHARKKYAAKFKGLPSSWIFPTGQALEQSSSVATAKFKGELLSTPNFVDLCAGMGIDTWAMENRSATKRGLAFELNKSVARLLEANLEKTHVIQDQARLDLIDEWIKTEGISKEDLTIYLDPDRRAQGKRSFGIADCTPNLIALQEELLARSSKVISKHSPMLDLESINELSGVQQMFIIQSKGECKEVIVLQQANHKGEWPMVLVDVDTQTRLIFGERSTQERLPRSAAFKQYLVQPSAGLGKSLRHEELAREMNWTPTIYGNLYTCDKPSEPSPFYRVYRIKEESQPYKFKQKIEKAAIECIGFPESVAVVRKKLKAKEGNTSKVFALKADRKKCMILTERIC